MLELGCPILDFFQLILGVPPKLTPNAVNESLRAFEVLLKKSLELWPRDQSGALVAALVLNLSKADRVPKE